MSLQSGEASSMLTDLYKSFNRIIVPTKADTEQYLKSWDKTKDDYVSYQDVEDMCIRYLTQQQP